MHTRVLKNIPKIDPEIYPKVNPNIDPKINLEIELKLISEFDPKLILLNDLENIPGITLWNNLNHGVK